MARAHRMQRNVSYYIPVRISMAFATVFYKKQLGASCHFVFVFTLVVQNVVRCDIYSLPCVHPVFLFDGWQSVDRMENRRDQRRLGLEVHRSGRGQKGRFTCGRLSVKSTPVAFRRCINSYLVCRLGSMRPLAVVCLRPSPGAATPR